MMATRLRCVLSVITLGLISAALTFASRAAAQDSVHLE
jgi:hypothetical protein